MTHKRTGTPADDHIQAIKCPGCGRWITKVASSIPNPQRVHMQVNWDKFQGFFYIGRRSHNVRSCLAKKKPELRQSIIWDSTKEEYIQQAA